MLTNQNPPQSSPQSILERPMRFQDWATMRYHLLHAYAGKVLPRARAARSKANWHSCWLLRRGEVSVTASGKTVIARKGQWIFVAAPERQQLFSEDAEILSVRFDLTWPGGEPVLPVYQSFALDAGKFPQLEKAGAALARQVRKTFSDATPATFLPHQHCRMEQYLRVQNLMPQWLTVYLKAQASLGNFPSRLIIEDDRIANAVTELNRHPLDSPFPWKTLLQQTGLARSQFDALFERATGIPPKRYWTQRRQREAQELLAYSTMSIKQIANELGFRHPSYFSLWFRHLHETSASEFRRKHQPD